MIDLRKHAIALHFIRLGDVVIDAGAFIGSYSFFYRKVVGAKGLIVAYEPQPRAVATFRTKLQEKGIKNIILHQRAVSSTQGQRISMKVYAEQMVQSCTVEPLLMSQERMPGNTALVEVETAQLDSLKNELGGRRLSLIKIDTEGHESEVLKGAEALIKMHNPLIVMEYGYIPGSFEPTTISQLEALQYTCFDLKTLEKVAPRYVSELPTDLIAIPNRQLDIFYRIAATLPQNRLLLKMVVARKLGFSVLKSLIYS